MRTLEEIKAGLRIVLPSQLKIGDDGLVAVIKGPGMTLRIIASWGGRWDHVSVSILDRCPTWEEMCMVKDIFWNDEETVIQYHPAKSQYVNNHPFCLHLWKPQQGTIPLPPTNFV